MEFLEGKKTYLGLIVAFLGIIGVAKYFGIGEAERVVNLIFELGGILFAVYGRYKVNK